MAGCIEPHQNGITKDWLDNLRQYFTIQTKKALEHVI